MRFNSAFKGLIGICQDFGCGPVLSYHRHYIDLSCEKQKSAHEGIQQHRAEDAALATYSFGTAATVPSAVQSLA